MQLEVNTVMHIFKNVPEEWVEANKDLLKRAVEGIYRIELMGKDARTSPEGPQDAQSS